MKLPTSAPAMPDIALFCPLLELWFGLEPPPRKDPAREARGFEEFEFEEWLFDLPEPINWLRAIFCTAHHKLA